MSDSEKPNASLKFSGELFDLDIHNASNFA